jgi:hypothetical protein
MSILFDMINQLLFENKKANVQFVEGLQAGVFLWRQEGLVVSRYR